MHKREIEQIIVDGQVLFCPDAEQWENILQNNFFNGVSLGSSDINKMLKRKILINSEYPEIKSCIAVYKRWVMFYELLQLGEEFYRVFIESIICEYCGNRAKISATPEVSDNYIGLDNLNEEKARKKVRKLPNLSCPKCGKTYDRRYTVWQVN